MNSIVSPSSHRIISSVDPSSPGAAKPGRARTSAFGVEKAVAIFVGLMATAKPVQASVGPSTLLLAKPLPRPCHRQTVTVSFPINVFEPGPFGSSSACQQGAAPAAASQLCVQAALDDGGHMVSGVPAYTASITLNPGSMGSVLCTYLCTIETCP